MTTADASKPSPDRYLGIYLNDHRAGATAGLALAKRVLRENEGSPLADTLRSVLGEIEEEAATLDLHEDHGAVRHGDRPFREAQAGGDLA